MSSCNDELGFPRGESAHKEDRLSIYHMHGVVFFMYLTTHQNMLLIYSFKFHRRSIAIRLLNITKHRKGVEVMECNQGCVTSRICNAFLWPTFVMKL